jgi:hypothetical protein
MIVKIFSMQAVELHHDHSSVELWLHEYLDHIIRDLFVLDDDMQQVSVLQLLQIS